MLLIHQGRLRPTSPGSEQQRRVENHRQPGSNLLLSSKKLGHFNFQNNFLFFHTSSNFWYSCQCHNFTILSMSPASNNYTFNIILYLFLQNDHTCWCTCRKFTKLIPDPSKGRNAPDTISPIWEMSEWRRTTLSEDSRYNCFQLFWWLWIKITSKSRSPLQWFYYFIIFCKIPKIFWMFAVIFYKYQHLLKCKTIWAGPEYSSMLYLNCTGI